MLLILAAVDDAVLGIGLPRTSMVAHADEELPAVLAAALRVLVGAHASGANLVREGRWSAVAVETSWWSGLR